MRSKKRSKIKKWITISIVIIVVVGLGAAFLMRPTPTRYESVAAETGDITTYYSFSGNIATKNRQTVISEKVMQISEIVMSEGDKVEEGDVLMKSTTGDEIVAKISGEIVNLNVEENAQVMTGIKLLEIVDYSDLEISVKVDEYDISAIEVGKETSVTIGAIDKELTGTISSISKEGQVLNGITFFIATIDLEPDDSLRVGMSAEVKLTSNQAIGVVTLPMTTIQFDENNNPYVLKKDENGTIVNTEITTGINDSSTVEVTSGVTNAEDIYYPSTTAAAGGFGFGAGGNTGGPMGGND
ncbi:MAG: efflux RND transporter periplasmic adaptor subunit [Mobilitalea sp.]